MACGALAAITKALCVRGTAKDVVQAWIAADEDILAIPSATNHIISSDITFNDDEHWYEIGIDKVGSSFAFTGTGEGLSKEFENTVILFVNGVAPAVSNVVTGFIRGTFALLIKDKNGHVHLIGALGDGAEVNVLAQNDRNGYVITAKWNSVDLPYNYTGAITVA